MSDSGCVNERAVNERAVKGVWLRVCFLGFVVTDGES